MCAGPALAKADAGLRAKVSQADAQAIGPKTRLGKVKECELEKTAGGRGLHYSFDIISNGKTYETGVGAMNGAVFENQLESANPD